ncbi:tyrosine-type recombinase/integrase [Elioraea rosea]|uniref:tyrosine-type recombinase/integrase n=1 Tax=Elioraea rosea TaxID=2492390 RepID=UPI0011822384|nr:site-specific integrase [Elioraea rosea]
MSLTDLTIRSLRPRAAGHYEAADARGLALRVHPNGRMVWVLRATDGRTGERVRRAIGEYGEGEGKVGLKAARKLADTWRAKLSSGLDPEGDMTVADAVEGWLKDAGLRSAEQVRRRMALHVLPKLGKRPIATITLKDVAALLRELRHDRGLTAEVNRVRSSMSAVFAWAKRQGEVVANPVLETERVIEPSQRREKEEALRVLDMEEIACVWRAAEADGSRVVSALVRLLILVPLRREEWTALRWDEIEETAVGLTLRLPAARMKGKRPHAVPLPDDAAAIVRSMPRHGPFVFTIDGKKPFAGWRTAADRLRDAVALAAPWVLHDLRRSTATHMGEAGISEATIAALLAHSRRRIAGITATYDRSERIEEKRAALDRWARVLHAHLNPAAAENVTPLRATVG